ncbi:MAG: porin family protein [Muribaculaceae bacterium]|nr:porin family protein [Muribaculaceae bacterium]
MPQRILKRILALTIVALFAVTEVKAQDYIPKEKTIGVEAGYNSKNQSALAGIAFSYRFSHHFRLAPNVQYVFNNKNIDGFSINIDAHVPFGLKNTPVELYPIAGMNYSMWNNKAELFDQDFNNDVSTRQSNFGLNLGGGVGMKFSAHLRLFVEGRYTFVRHFSTAMVSAGIVYSF